MRRWIPHMAAAGLLLALVGRGAAGDDPKALVEKAIKAHGGEEKLNKLKAGTSKAKGTLTLMGMELPFTQESSYLLPDKVKETLNVEVMGMKIPVITIINGDKASITANGQKVELNDSIKAEIKEASYLLRATRLGALRGKEFTLSALGERKVEDKPALGIKVSSKGHRDIDLYFDKKSGLLVRLEHRGVDPMSGQEFTEERIVKEYQEIDGMPMPKKVLVNRDGKKFMEVEIVEAKLADTVDENEFAVQ